MLNPWLLLIQQNLSQPWAGFLALPAAPGLCKELLNDIHGAIWPQLWDANAICSLKIAQRLRGVVQHLLLLGKEGAGKGGSRENPLQAGEELDELWSCSSFPSPWPRDGVGGTQRKENGR